MKSIIDQAAASILDAVLLTKHQAAGLLNVDARTLVAMGIPCVTLMPGQVRYRLVDIKAHIEKNLA
jgi:hypothetical protein